MSFPSWKLWVGRLPRVCVKRARRSPEKIADYFFGQLWLLLCPKLHESTSVDGDGRFCFRGLNCFFDVSFAPRRFAFSSCDHGFKEVERCAQMAEYRPFHLGVERPRSRLHAN